MHITPFSIEAFFALYEFNTPYLLCSSDCESMTVGELLELAVVETDSLLSLRLGYTESQGNPDLRAAVAGHYEQVRADDVVVLAAPEEGIYVALRALLEPGDHVVVLTPAYASLLNLADHIAGEHNVSRWEVRPAGGRWQVDLDELERLVTSRTRLLVVNFPHNPTGFLPTADTFATIVDIARRNGAWLLCDEMYRGLELDPAERLPSAGDLYERAIVLAGLSKVHGLPGLRSGWLICRDAEVRQALIDWKFYTTICPPAPSEFLAGAALRAHDALAARNRDLIARNLGLAGDFFARHAELFDWRPPQAGSVALVGLNVPSATTYCHSLAAEAGVLLLPSSCLGYGDRHVRFGFGRANFPEALAHYERFLATS